MSEDREIPEQLDLGNVLVPPPSEPVPEPEPALSPAPKEKPLVKDAIPVRARNFNWREVMNSKWVYIVALGIGVLVFVLVTIKPQKLIWPDKVADPSAPKPDDSDKSKRVPGEPKPRDESSDELDIRTIGSGIYSIGRPDPWGNLHPIPFRVKPDDDALASDAELVAEMYRQIKENADAANAAIKTKLDAEIRGELKAAKDEMKGEIEALHKKVDDGQAEALKAIEDLKKSRTEAPSPVPTDSTPAPATAPTPAPEPAGPPIDHITPEPAPAPSTTIAPVHVGHSFAGAP